VHVCVYTHMAYEHSLLSGRLTMSCYVLFILFVVLNYFSFVKLKTYGFMTPSNSTCVNIPLASLSSRSDDRYLQL